MSRKGFSKVSYTVLGCSLAVAASAVGQTSQPAMTDAQIEANVLRALASAPDLSTQNIQTSTVYGTVTLTGNVHDEAMRTETENLVARAAGVKKVVDELSLGDAPPPTDQASDQGAGAPPDAQQAENAQPPVPGQDQPNPGQQTAPPDANQQYPGGYGPPQGQTQQPYAAPQANQQYPGAYGPPSAQAPGQNQQQYPGGYGPPAAAPDQSQQQPYGPPARRPLYSNNGPQQAYNPPGGQVAGVQVTVPAGAMLRIRINRGLDSNHLQPGTPFDGTVLSDVPADGEIAIPRGAQVQGTVVNAKKAGVLSGHGELSLAINSVTLGGVTYPLTTELWQRNGRDKSASTVNSALGLGALGAIFGGIAGGGAGAAIGAAAGGAVGVAGSASSPGGRVIIPPEAVISFQLAQPAIVKTVSEQEMSRLAYAAGPNPQQPQPPMRRYYSPYYGYYYAPY